MSLTASAPAGTGGRRPRWLRAGATAAASAVALVALAQLGVTRAERTTPAPAGWPEGSDASVTLLALGDTGRTERYSSLFDEQLAVGRALAAADRRLRADALLFLGDNFYPHGLRAHELVKRIRSNLVRPYCRFVELSGPRSAEVEPACPLSPAERRPIPMLAVLGNHDHGAAESPRLQREAIPEFVANWHLARDPVEEIALEGGVSLILYDSEVLEERGDFSPLTEAVRSARGPWLVLVAHRPIDATGYGAAVGQALARADRRAHLHLGGHDHNLQIGTLDPPGPPLQVVAGGGASGRESRYAIPQRRFLAVSTGFACIELRGGSQGERLVVSLVATPRYPFQLWKSPRSVARWSVDRAGQVRDESAAAPAAG